jgi:hypothetical protein
MNTYNKILLSMNNSNSKEFSITDLKDKGLINKRIDRDSLDRLVKDELISLRKEEKPTDVANQYIITKYYSITQKGIDEAEKKRTCEAYLGSA